MQAREHTEDEVTALAIAMVASVHPHVVRKNTGAKSAYVPRWLMRDLVEAVEAVYPEALERMRTKFAR